MISCTVLEQPGKWRLPAIAAGLLLALAPPLLLVCAADGRGTASFEELLRSGFGSALIRSLAVALAVALLAVVVGLPTGMLAGLYEFPLRRFLLTALALPLLVPSFLGAIGLSMLPTAFGLSAHRFLFGFTGTVLAFTPFALPLVVFITLASVRGITQSQRDAARLAGGECHFIRCVARSVLPVATLTGLLVSVVTLSDPGPGQILGYSGAASDILVSFASQHDFALASRQCLLLAAVVCVVGLPVIALLAPRVATGLLGRDVTPAPLARTGGTRLVGPAGLLALSLLTTALPLLGLALPLLRSFPIEYAMKEVSRTLSSTLFYSLGASALATGLGVALALAAGRSPANRVMLVAGLLLLLALPPSLGALGISHRAGLSPSQLDPLLRSRFTVSLSLALRLAPIAAIFALRSLGTTSPTWASAAALHGVPLPTYLRKVLAPWMARALLPGALLIALLALADVTTVLLLHPPGKASLPLAIFTVMANAPESLVSALCLLYVGGAGLALLVGTALLTRREMIS
jgi:iron(III) transport system permease protein